MRNFQSAQNFMRFPQAICNEHKQPIIYFNTDRFAQLNERCLCLSCKLNEPTLIEEALKQVNYLVHDSNLIMKNFLNFENSVNETKTVIIQSIEQKFSQINTQIEVLKNVILRIDMLIKYQTQGQRFQLRDLQLLAHMLYNKKNDKNIIQEILENFIESKKLYEEELIDFFRSLFEKIKSQFKQLMNRQDFNSTGYNPEFARCYYHYPISHKTFSHQQKQDQLLSFFQLANICDIDQLKNLQKDQINFDKIQSQGQLKNIKPPCSPIEEDQYLQCNNQNPQINHQFQSPNEQFSNQQENNSFLQSDIFHIKNFPQSDQMLDSQIQKKDQLKIIKEQIRFKLNGEVSCSNQLPNLQLLLGLHKDKMTNFPTLELLSFTEGNKFNKQEKNTNGSESVTAIHYNENLQHILVGYQDGQIDLYDISQQWQKKSNFWKFSGKIYEIYSFKNSKSQNDFEMLSCGQINFFKSFQVNNYIKVNELHQIKLTSRIINFIVLQDEKSVAILTEKGINFYRINSWDLSYTITLQNPIALLAFENQIIIGTQSGAIQIFTQKTNADQFEVQQAFDLRNEVLQLLCQTETKQIFIREQDQVFIYEFAVSENQWLPKYVIAGQFYHLGIIKRQDKNEIGFFQKESSQIIVFG